MKIIVGLGNPGTEYALTHHNMGFLTIDELSEKLSVKVNKIRFKSLIGECVIGGEKVILVKPQTFMNLSGEAVREVMQYYKAQPEDLLVIYDDIDLETGHLRVRKSGSAGSHNGMKNVVYLLQYDNFSRLRIGIGKPEGIPLINYVTMKITDDEAPVLKKAVVRAAEAAVCFAEKGIDEVMRIYNTNTFLEEKDK